MKLFITGSGIGINLSRTENHLGLSLSQIKPFSINIQGAASKLSPPIVVDEGSIWVPLPVDI